MKESRSLVPVLIFLGMVAAVVGSLGAPLVPTVSSVTHVSLADAQWSLTISLLTGAVATPVMGRLGDGSRRRRVVLVALAMVGLGSTIAALPLAFPWLLVGRALMGIGLGLTPLTMATARDALSGERQHKAVAMLSITTVAGIGLGYPVFGFIADQLSLRAAFWFCTGIVVVAFAAAAKVFPAPSTREKTEFDLIGAVLLGLGVAGIILTLSELEAWTLPILVATGVASVVALALWVTVELRSDHPLIDLRLLAHRSVITADITALFAGFGMYVLMSLSVRFVQTPTDTGYGFGSSVALAGLVLLPFSVMSVLATRIAPLIAARWGSRSVLPIGSVLFVVAEAAFVLDRSSLWLVFVVMGIAGLGIGSIFAGVPALIVSAVPASETGSAMALNQVLRYVGYCAGSASAATILEAHTAIGAVLPTNDGYTVAGTFGVAALIVAALVSALVPTTRNVAADPELVEESEAGAFPLDHERMAGTNRGN